jgi:hypothetical protein
MQLIYIVLAIYHLHSFVVYSYCIFLLRQCILVDVTMACCFVSAGLICVYSLV